MEVIPKVRLVGEKQPDFPNLLESVAFSDRGTIAKIGKPMRVTDRRFSGFDDRSTGERAEDRQLFRQILFDHLLTENSGQQHPRCVLRIGFLLAKLRLRQSVAAVCVLSVAFSAAFHIFVPSGTAWHSRSVPAVYAASDHTAPCSDQLIVEGCHVHVGAVIASFDVQVGSDQEQVSPPAAAPLVSFQPKMTGPPPKT